MDYTIDYIIEPDTDRDRKMTNYKSYKCDFSGIIYQKYNGCAAIMFQYEDCDGTPIKDSVALKMKDPITKFTDLLQTIFVPDLEYCADMQRFKIPSNVHSVVVLGIMRKYNSENNALCKFGIGDMDAFEHEYFPTIGANSTFNSTALDGSLYGLSAMNTAFCCNQFNFTTHERILSLGNDLIKKIVFKNGYFDYLETVKPIVEVGQVKSY